uniref:Lebercilin domain-containing protein n=2 Tax=Schistosoma mansoni TaxID=6183 RepID=A0A5K4F8C5_SCHMA
MCNLLPNYQVTADCSEAYETDSEFSYSVDKDLKSYKASKQKSKQNKGNNPSTKSSLKNISYKSKLSQHNPTIKPSSQSRFDHVSSTSSSKKPNINNKLSSGFLERWESNQLALADANSLIAQLNKELKDCKLELKTLQRQYKMQAVRLDKVSYIRFLKRQEADMPQIVDRLNSEIRTLQIRLRDKTLQSSADQRKISELQQRIYLLEKTFDEKNNQSQYTDEGSQLKHQLDLLTKSHKQQINMNNEKLRSLQQEYQHLKSKLYEKTQQLQEKTKLLELQNVYSHRIPRKNIILGHLPTLSSTCSTNDIDNYINDNKEAIQKSNSQLMDQNKCNSGDKHSSMLPQISANDYNHNKINVDVSSTSSSSQNVDRCDRLQQLPNIQNDMESNLEVNQLIMMNGKVRKLSNHEYENSSQEVIQNHQTNESNLQSNKVNNNNDTEVKLMNELTGKLQTNDLSINHNEMSKHNHSIQLDLNSKENELTYENHIYTTTKMNHESNTDRKNIKEMTKNKIEERKYKKHLIQTLQEIDKKEINNKHYDNPISSQSNLLHNPINNSVYHNTGKTREEELWNDLFGSIKDKVNETSEVIHQPSNDEILLRNNYNTVNEYTHNSNYKTGINQENNNDNDKNHLFTSKSPSWLTFHKTVNQLSNEFNMTDNRNSLNNIEHRTFNNNNNRFNHITTSQLDNIDTDIEVLQI